MKLLSTPRGRIAGFIAAAAAVLWLDRAFAPTEATEVAVIGPVTRPRGPALAAAEAGGTATRTSMSRVAGLAGPDAELERIARWQRFRAAALDEGAASPVQGDLEPVGSDPFAPVAWAAPAASAARPLPPPPPPPPPAVAPLFPYAYIGALSDDGIRTLFFAKGERVLVVKAGDVVDAAFRIDEINDKQMTLTYVPMNQSAVVALGAAR